LIVKEHTFQHSASNLSLDYEPQSPDLRAMAEEQQNRSAENGAQPPLGWLTPEQMEQITRAIIEQLQPLLNSMQNPKAKTQFDSPPPANPQVLPIDNPLPPSNPATPPPAARSSQSATTSLRAVQGSSRASQSRRKKKATYEVENDNGKKSIRRYQKRLPPYDQHKDSRMICHTAVHKVCSAIVRVFGFNGEW
jgi:hypothetical protein